MSYKELPNVKVGVTNSVHRRLRDLKQKGDNFNDVIERLLPKEESKPFDIVEALSVCSTCREKIYNCQCVED